MDLGLKNKNAIVCGSTQGIGEATAQELARQGANITLVARNKDVLSNVLESLDKSLGQSHRFVCIDFSADNFLEKIQALDQSYDILINNTGGPAGGPIIDAKPQAFLDAFKMHLINNQLLVSHVVQSMKVKNFGRIINVISTSVKAPIQGLGVSNTIRAAVANWAKTLSLELGPFGITVNNVLPGFTNTNRLTSIIQRKANEQSKSIDDVSKAMQSSVPARRFGESHEVANAVAFLSSVGASYINGINLPVDGGRTASL
ncbi:MAG: SDR family oxidoreductase [Flavobacteriales bacterium]|jgi:3-oxoacyl-[acyl-carrier protein] reductase|tara:strand:- start:15294 stop:16070 length:777 start_codon:yes stop_codon:yes gene_type:complete